ncbi:LexA/Signal peptidase, partial [Hymenopellis radicata]
QPTLNPDTSMLRQDFGLFDRISVKASADFQRGDIVLVTSPVNARRTLIKRVIAKEGDLVTTLPPYPEPQVRVPLGHVWIEGDDPAHSDDSRSYGPIPAGLVQAKLLWLVWPLDRFGPVKTPTQDELGRLLRDGPSYREAVAAIHREGKRKSRVIPA